MKLEQVRLTALSESLAETYGRLVFDFTDRPAFTGPGGKLQYVCGRCDFVIADGFDHPLPFLNAAACCPNCGVHAHLTKPSRYNARVPMLQDYPADRAASERIESAGPDALNNNLSREIKTLNEGIRNRFSELQGMPPRQLYHYTSTQGLYGILTSGSVWASDLGYLNDASELTYAAGLIEKEIGALKHSVNEHVSELFRRSQSEASPDNASNGYLAICFCAKGDLLSQWRAYADSGKGCALGFDAPALSYSAGELFKVIYKEEEQVALIRETIDIVTQSMSASIETLGEMQVEEILPTYSMMLRYHLNRMIFTFKHPSFEEESEWRLIFPYTRDETLDILGFRQAGALLVPYMPISFGDGTSNPKLPLLDIVHGPTLNPGLYVKSLHQIIEKFGYEHVEVTGSGAPLRV